MFNLINFLMDHDVLFSDDLQSLRFEIVRLRAIVENEFRITESYRAQCERLNVIINSFISHEYGKS